MTTPPLPPGQDPYQQPPPEYSQGPYPVSGSGQPYSAYPPGYQQYSQYPPYQEYPPYSDKSKVAAGLLQLLPGFFLGLGGIGRIYTGHISLGVIHLVVSGLAYLSFCCSGVTFGLALVAAVPLAIGAWLWAVIDGIVLLAGRPTDAQGRPLRL